MRSRFARFVAALRSRSVLICFCPPLRLVVVALNAGSPAPLTALQASPAFLRARAPAAKGRCPRYARANLGLRPADCLATLGTRLAYGLAGSATLRPKVCAAPAGVFRFNRRVAVQLP